MYVKTMSTELLIREEIRLEALLNFNPILPAYQKITNDSVAK